MGLCGRQFLFSLIFQNQIKRMKKKRATARAYMSVVAEREQNSQCANRLAQLGKVYVLGQVICLFSFRSSFQGRELDEKILKVPSSFQCWDFLLLATVYTCLKSNRILHFQEMLHLSSSQQGSKE